MFCVRCGRSWRSTISWAFQCFPTGRSSEAIGVRLMNKRTCATCGDEFIQTNNRRKASTYCPSCYREYHRAWRERQKEEDPLVNQRKNCWEKHRLYPEEVIAWKEALGNKCPICNEEFENTQAKKACVDHDHNCCPKGRSCASCRRGLICFNCNTVLGKVNDNPEVLLSMIDYLKESKNGRVRGV